MGRCRKGQWITINPEYAKRVRAEAVGLRLARVVYLQHRTGQNHEREIFELAKLVVDLVGTKDTSDAS